MARPDPRSLPHPIRVMRIIARLNIGGPAVHVSLLTAGLNDGEFTSRLVTGVIGEAEGDMSYLAREMGVEPVVIPTMRREIEPLNDLRTLRALTRLMREFRPHVVHTHTAKAGFVGRLAARLTGVPVVVHTFHGHVFHGYFGPAKTRLFIELERLAARGSDVILTISERLRGDLLAYRIAPPEKIRVVPLGLPLDSLRDLDGLRGGLRRELGVSTDTQLVGIIGRLVPIKNHDLFLAAARRVREERPDTHFVIVGDGERRAELEALVQEMGLADAVTFTGWRDDLPGIYADLDVLVISSRNEGTPVSIIEAMAAGVPVVSTDVGGVADVLLGGELGRLTPPSDADALARGIVEALCEGRGPRTEAACTRAFEQYGAARLVEDMRALYRELLAGKGAPMRDGE
ncbi:MAG TPA: glycosyltransferase family 4 protein [Aggregatilineales bacterium]|nr:glycosyltransferase family 4 protein [Aggregatilineales bacterium]